MTHAVYKTSYVKLLQTLVAALSCIVLIQAVCLAIQSNKTSYTRSLSPSEANKEVAELKEYMQDVRSRLWVKQQNPSLPYNQIIQHIAIEKAKAERYNVPLSLGLAISKEESHFKTQAVSPTGPIGVKQIAFTYWNEHCNLTYREQLYDHYTNVDCGYSIIHSLKQRAKAWEEALKLYYGGTPSENLAYSKKVMNTKKRLDDFLKTGKT